MGETYSENEYFETIIRQLPEQQSKVIKLCKINGANYAEAAKKLNLTLGTISIHLVKAMKHLKGCVERKN